MNMYNSNVNKNINMENSLQEDWEKAFRTFDHQQKVATPTAIDYTSSIKKGMEQLEDIQVDYMGTIDDNKYQDVLLEQRQGKENRASTNHTAETLSAIQWKNLGMTLQENNDDKSAIQAFSNAVNIDTSLTDAWLGLAISYANEHNRGKVYDCLFSWLLNNQHYQSIVKHDLLFLEKEGKNDDGLLMKEMHGNHDYEEQLLYKRHQQLIELYLKVARSIPGHGDINSITNSNKEITIDTDVQIILGLLFYLSKEEKKMMDMEKAMDCFETALSYKSDDYRVWNQLGAIFAQQPHQHHQAVEMYQSALQLNKSFIRARYNLAILLMKMGLYEQAAHHLTVALMDQQTSIMEISDIYKSSFDSTEIWSSLRLVMYMLNLDHLAEACNQKDLSQFDYFIHLEN
ncbi:hypothetical protein BJ944DRAFT_271152 [Cunninghamella echinulata]|nr:hypothetical protein BJ944DRAFT_271152 [Cunninghamella echinulata]